MAANVHELTAALEGGGGAEPPLLMFMYIKYTLFRTHPLSPPNPVCVPTFCSRSSFFYCFNYIKIALTSIALTYSIMLVSLCCSTSIDVTYNFDLALV